MKVELGLNQPGFTCDNCRWKIELNDCPWDYDYDKAHSYAEDCCHFRNISDHSSKFLEEETNDELSGR